MTGCIQKGTLSTRSYRRAFARPLKAAWGTWTVREGLVLRFEDPATKSPAFSEIAPLPPAKASLPADPSVPQVSSQVQATARTAALLTLSEETPVAIIKLREAGYRTFKLKMGVNDPGKEWGFLQEVAITLIPGERLRLDPNRSWDSNTWTFWKPRLNGISMWIEFIEEPFKSIISPEGMLRRAEGSPIPLALDESLTGDGLASWLKQGWSGYWIIKPTLLGDPEAWRQPLIQSRGKVVISSVFETGIGLSTLIRLAREFPGIDHGLGTQNYFDDDLGVPQMGPELTALSTEQQEELWKRLPES